MNVNCKMTINRLWNQFRASVTGYFWLPCPVCGRMFGGHEKRGSIPLMHSYSSGQAVCSEQCSEIADRLNKERGFYDLPPIIG